MNIRRYVGKALEYGALIGGSYLAYNQGPEIAADIADWMGDLSMISDGWQAPVQDVTEFVLKYPSWLTVPAIHQGMDNLVDMITPNTRNR
jgi:hypothetical protein